MPDYYYTQKAEDEAKALAETVAAGLAQEGDTNGHYHVYQHHGRFKVAWVPADDTPIFLFNVSETATRPCRLFVGEEDTGQPITFYRTADIWPLAAIVEAGRQKRDRALAKRQWALNIRRMNDLLESLEKVQGVTVKEEPGALSVVIALHNVPADKAAAVMERLRELVKAEGLYAVEG